MAKFPGIKDTLDAAGNEADRVFRLSVAHAEQKARADAAEAELATLRSQLAGTLPAEESQALLHNATRVVAALMLITGSHDVVITDDVLARLSDYTLERIDEPQYGGYRYRLTKDSGQ